MQKIYFFSFIILLFSSCSPAINYIGSTNAPTSHVDVFVNDATIKKNYDIVGKGYVHEITFNKRIEKIQKRAIEKAMNKGADAVLIQDYYVPNTGTSINTTMRSDSLNKGLITVGNTTVQSTGSSGFNIYFLKYTN